MGTTTEGPTATTTKMTLIWSARRRKDETETRTCPRTTKNTIPTKTHISTKTSRKSTRVVRLTPVTLTPTIRTWTAPTRRRKRNRLNAAKRPRKGPNKRRKKKREKKKRGGKPNPKSSSS